MKRGYAVIGSCGMDSGPRIHAQQICRLAAKAGQWDIFVRAHLNIMNDNFERVSDGLYAYGQRETYLRELETLGINTPDLLVGSCLQTANPSAHHYMSTSSRVGRALAESRNHTISKLLSEMANDPSLDLHNRMELTWLLYHYLTYLHDKALVQETKADFRKTIGQLPLGLSASFRHVIENVPE